MGLIFATLAGGCAGGEEVFTAEELIASINAHGAAVALGPVLTTSDQGVEVQSVTLAESDPGSAPAGFEGDAHGGGAVLVLGDSEAARIEVERCQASLSLICFRAANAVLRFEGLFPAEQARITEAFQALAEG